MLEVMLQKHLASFRLDVAFTVGQELAVLFGPSGSGKSLTLQALAGIVQPETANEERTVLGNGGPQRVAVFGCPARWLAGGLDVQYRQLAMLQVHVEN